VVAGNQCQLPFTQDRLAESFRSELVTAARKGEAFDIETGLPVSQLRARRSNVSFFTLACQYADLKWPHRRVSRFLRQEFQEFID
jgi:hypothetical protein